MKYAGVYRKLPREIYAIFFAQTVNSIGALIYPFMTLLFSKKIGMPPGQTGVAVTAIALAFGPASLIGGKLVDSIGRKVVLLGFEAVAMLAYFACFFVPTGPAMIALIALAVICYGISDPAHSAMVADYTEGKQREAAYSLLYLGHNIGFAVAQIFAGALFLNYFRLLFLIDGITTAAALVVISIMVAERSGLSLKSARLNKSSRLEQTMDRAALEGSTAESVAGVGEDAGDVGGEDVNAVESGLSTIQVLKKAPVLLYFAIAALGYRFTYAQWGFLVPLQTDASFGDAGAAFFGYMGSFNAIVVVVLTPLVTGFFGRWTNIRRIVIAGAFFTIGFGMFGYIQAPWLFFLAVFLFTVGEIFEAVSIMPFIMNHTPPTHRGRMSAVIPILMGVGYAMGPLIMGGIYERTSFRFSWTLAAVCAGLAMLGMMLIALGEKKPGNRQEDTGRPEE